MTEVGTSERPGGAAERPWTAAAVLAAPGLLLAAIGLTHVHYLTPDVARGWVLIHVVMLPLFPLLAVALLVPLRHERGPLVWLARIAAYCYAVLYTVLDVLAGIGAGVLVASTGRSDASVGLLFDVGRGFGRTGGLMFVVAAVLTAAALWRRGGTAVLPGGALLVVGGVLFTLNHVYFPWGVLGQVAIGAGTAWIALAARGRHRPVAAVPAQVEPG